MVPRRRKHPILCHDSQFVGALRRARGRAVAQLVDLHVEERVVVVARTGAGASSRRRSNVTAWRCLGARLPCRRRCPTSAASTCAAALDAATLRLARALLVLGVTASSMLQRSLDELGVLVLALATSAKLGLERGAVEAPLAGAVPRQPLSLSRGRAPYQLARRGGSSLDAAAD